MTDPEIRKAADAEHTDAAGSDRFGGALAAGANRPEKIFEITGRHTCAVVLNDDLPLICCDLNMVGAVGRGGLVTNCLNADRVNGVLHVLTDESQRRFIDLLRDGAQNVLEIYANLE